MAAAFLFGLLLIASARSAAGDGGATLPAHLELPATPESSRGQGSAAPPQGLMDIMSMSGCGRFAGLVAETADARDVLEEQIVADRGLTVFCPEDKAVDAFEPTFRALADRDRLAVLLLHGVAARYGPAQLAAFEWVELRTLGVADAGTNKSKAITIRAHKEGDTVWLWPSPRSCNCGDARIIKTVSSEEGPLAVHLVDAMLTLPCPLRKKLDGEDEAAGSGGYLGWLDGCIPVSRVLCGVAGVILGHVGAPWVLSRMPWNRVQ